MKLTKLRNIGLTEGEIKVYTGLIKLGETTTGPLVDESGVSLSKVYAILDRLAKKGNQDISLSEFVIRDRHAH